ncbi:MAG: DUF433 domain-containing protein [Verrucomicrobia bacterium]|nr:DUF433 domain-containing protein [Verrucomicrobiota bacterium]
MESGAPLSFPPDVPIWVDPVRLSGAPCFKSTRVPVDSLFTNLESGLSLDEHLDCFPDVTCEQGVAVLAYRGDRGMDYTRKVCSPAFRRPEPAEAGTTNADLSFIQRSRQYAHKLTLQRAA